MHLFDFISNRLPVLLHCIAVWALCVTAQSSSSSVAGSTITYTILGAPEGVGGNTSVNSTLLANFTVWGEYPVALIDTVYSVLVSALNGDAVVPGTTPTPKAEQKDEPMRPEWIALIVVGGVIGVTAIILAIYFGVKASKANKRQDDAPLLPQDPPPAEQDRRVTSFVPSVVYPSPPGGRYSKVIQVPIVCPRAPGAVAPGGPCPDPAPPSSC